MKYYVYDLIESLNNSIFYVGKGSGNRLHKHIQIARGESKNKGKNPKLYNKINKVINGGGSIITKKIFETDIEREALDFETKRIAEIGLQNLTNLTVGGEGTSFPDGFTEEHKKRISLSKRGKTYPHMLLPRNKKPMSDEQKKNFRIKRQQNGTEGYWKGKSLSDDTKRKMSEAHSGKVFSEQHRKSLSDALVGKRNKLGYQTSPKTKEQISQSLRKHYADHIVGSKTRKLLSDIAKSKLVNGKRVLSDEARKKMSDGAKKRNSLRKDAIRKAT